MSNPSFPTTFPSFCKLAPEIRLQIWGLALENSQCLELRCRKYTISSRTSDYHWHWYSLSPIPALLHVCFESRVEALKAYQSHILNIHRNTSSQFRLQEKYQESSSIQELENTGMVYLNRERDTVVIHYGSDSTNQFNISTANLACADLIKNLGISSHKVGIETLLDIYGMQLFLSPFRNVQRIFQIEITSREYHEQEIRIVMNRPGIYSTRLLNGYDSGMRMVEIGMNFTKSTRFWFHVLMRKALENLREGSGFGVRDITVVGTEAVLETGGLKPWYSFVDDSGRMPHSRLLA